MSNLLFKTLRALFSQTEFRPPVQDAWDYNAQSLDHNNLENIPFWSDDSGFDDMMMTVSAATPFFIADAINGNPAVRFTAPNAMVMKNAGLGLQNITDGITIFFYGNIKEPQASALFVTDPPNNTENYINVHLPYRLGSGSDVVAFDFGNRNEDGRLGGNTDEGLWDSNFDQFYLWEFKVRPGYMAIYRDAEIVYEQFESSEANFTNEVLAFGLPWSADLGPLIADIARHRGFPGFLSDYDEKRLQIISELNDDHGLNITVPAQILPSLDSLEVEKIGVNSVDFIYSITPGNIRILDIQYRVSKDGQLVQDWSSIGRTYSGGFSVGGIDINEIYQIELAVLKTDYPSTRIIVGSVNSNLEAAGEDPSIETFELQPGDGYFTIGWAALDGNGTLTAVEYELGNDPGNWIALPTQLQGSQNVNANNAQEYSVNLKVTTSVSSVTAGPETVTPEEIQQIVVDDYSGTDTQKIDAAYADAVAQDLDMLFSDREWYYAGDKTWNNGVKMIGGQVEAPFYSGPDISKTTIHVDGTFYFRAEIIMDGIWLSGDRNEYRPFRVQSGSLHATRSFFSGAQTTSTGMAQTLRIEGGVTSVHLIKSKVFDSHSTRDIDAGTNSVSCRGIHMTNSFGGLIWMEDFEIYDVGMDVRFSNGDKFIDNPDYDNTAWDIDAIDIRGNGGSGRRTVIKNMLIRSCVGTYVKDSEGGYKKEIEDLHLHIRDGEPQRGRIVRLQSSDSHGWMNDTTVEIDNPDDIQTNSGANLDRILIMFGSQGDPAKSMMVDGTHFKIGVGLQNPAYSPKYCFGYRDNEGDRRNLTIQNTTLECAGGMRSFFFGKCRCGSNPDKLSEVNFYNNTELEGLDQFFRYEPDLRTSAASGDECHPYRTYFGEINNCSFYNGGVLRDVDAHIQNNSPDLGTEDSGIFFRVDIDGDWNPMLNDSGCLDGESPVNNTIKIDFTTP